MIGLILGVLIWGVVIYIGAMIIVFSLSWLMEDEFVNLVYALIVLGVMYLAYVWR
jgi:hypothetical protein